MFDQNTTQQWQRQFRFVRAAFVIGAFASVVATTTAMSGWVAGIAIAVILVGAFRQGSY
ncbi:MAG: hypothetical protein IPM06_18680 [Rhizobiales bacterium]|nr:hypothetical protein [Hyphomicrobiales bacterium]